MALSFPTVANRAEFVWGRPPGLRGTPSSRFLYFVRSLRSTKGRQGGCPTIYVAVSDLRKLSGIGQSCLRPAFQPASPITALIHDTTRGYRVSEIEDKLMQQIRYLDKLVDELDKGKAMDKILRK